MLGRAAIIKHSPQNAPVAIARRSFARLTPIVSQLDRKNLSRLFRVRRHAVYALGINRDRFAELETPQQRRVAARIQHFHERDGSDSPASRQAQIDRPMRRLFFGQLGHRLETAVHEFQRAGVFDVRALVKLPIVKPESARDERGEERRLQNKPPRMTPRPFCCPHHRSRARHNQFVIEKPAQIFRERRRAFVTIGGIFIEALHADRFEIARNTRAIKSRRHRIRQKRRTAREHFVKDRA